jgi:hypothetical protein
MRSLSKWNLQAHENLAASVKAVYTKRHWHSSVGNMHASTLMVTALHTVLSLARSSAQACQRLSAGPRAMLLLDLRTAAPEHDDAVPDNSLPQALAASA